jgi:putative transcriptional regulator
MTKRKIFDEMMEGVAAMKSHREGKITLRTYKVEAAPLPKVDSKLIRDTRERLHCSRAVFARRLHINERTLEKWEQGRAKPNPQAAALVLLVRTFPDTLERLERVAVGLRSFTAGRESELNVRGSVQRLAPRNRSGGNTRPSRALLQNQ